jgi:peptide deformylase
VTVREVVRLPERVLKRRADEIGNIRVDELVADLVDTMRASPACVGLAAPQIGVSRRAIVVDVSSHPKTTKSHGMFVMFDPVVLDSRGRNVGREGCMSVPDLTANVARASEIVVRGTTPSGEDLMVATEGFEARALQHEIDHLDGYLILDRVASLATDVFKRKKYQ